jgi:hypothetical protein
MLFLLLSLLMIVQNEMLNTQSIKDAAVRKKW